MLLYCVLMYECVGKYGEKGIKSHRKPQKQGFLPVSGMITEICSPDRRGMGEHKATSSGFNNRVCSMDHTLLKKCAPVFQ